MDLFWFFVEQFKVPIIGITVLGILLWLKVFLIPGRRMKRNNIAGTESLQSNRENPEKECEKKLEG